MDYWAAIRDLYLNKQRLDKAIAILAALSEREEPVSQRGRKEHVPRGARRGVGADETLLGRPQKTAV
jgi:hypothetical protein